MKKLITLLTAASLSASLAVCASAADKAKAEPDVFVDGSRIIFSDQNAVIVDGRTLVPARGVFEAMGHKVTWNADDRTVSVESSTGVRKVLIAIDSDVMKIDTFKTIMEYESKETKLDVPAQIMNDRTMIPLRAVAEAFNSDVKWDGDAYAVNITSGAPILLEGFAPAPETPDENKVSMKLTSDAVGKELKAGDTFDVYVEVGNVPENYFVSGIVAAFEYDKTKFEYVEGSGTMLNDKNEAYTASIVEENLQYETGSKIVFLTIDENDARKSNGKAFKATFKSLAGDTGMINLGNAYESVLGYESYMQFTVKDDYYKNVEASGNKEALKQLDKNFDISVKGRDLNIGDPITIGE